MVSLPQSWRIAPTVVLLAVGLVACDTSDPTPQDTPAGTAATTAEPTPPAPTTPGPGSTSTTAPVEPSTAAPAPSPTATPTPPPAPKSVITVGPIDPPLSQAEIRVGEVIAEHDGTVTNEGTVLTLPEPILFDFDSSELKPASSDALDDIAEVLAFYKGAPVVVAGHTDSKGSHEYNDVLSQERADAVTTALVQRGIAQKRLTSVGRGERDPVARNTNDDGGDNPEGRARNRRVEVLIVGVEPPS